MSGLKVSRFPDISELQENEFKCNVCHQICRKPVKTRCDHMFCKFCINGWISEDNKKCPKKDCNLRLIHLNKRKPNTDQLNGFLVTKPDKKFIKSYKKLKIKCNFYDNGCHQLVSLGSLSRHLEECDYNLCTNCGLKLGKSEEHNCVQRLRLLLDEKNDQKESLLIKLEQFEKHMNDRNEAQKTFQIKCQQMVNKSKNEMKRSSAEKQLWKNRFNGLRFKYKKLLSEMEIKNKSVLNANQKLAEEMRDKVVLITKSQELQNENNLLKKKTSEQKLVIGENEFKTNNSLIKIQQMNAKLAENEIQLNELQQLKDSLENSLNAKIETQKTVIKETEQKSKNLLIKFQKLETIEKNLRKENDSLLSENKKQKSIIRDNSLKIESNYRELNKIMSEKKKNREKLHELEKQNNLLNAKIGTQNEIISGNPVLNKVLVFEFNATLKQYNSSRIPIIRKDFIRVNYINYSQIGLKYFGKNGSEYSIDKEMPINFSSVKRMHSAMIGLQTDSFRFLYNNRLIRDSDDPKSLALKNGSIIDVLLVIDLQNVIIINQKY